MPHVAYTIILNNYFKDHKQSSKFRIKNDKVIELITIIAIRETMKLDNKQYKCLKLRVYSNSRTNATKGKNYC